MNKFFSSLIILLSITFVECKAADLKNEPSYLQDENFLKYEKSCNNNEAQACYDLFNFFMDANDSQQSIRYGERACNLGNTDACLTMGFIFLEDDDKKNITKKLVAKSYFEKGCNYQSPVACYFVAFYDNLEYWGARNYNLEKNFLEKGCKLEVEYEQKDEYRQSFDKKFFKENIKRDACSSLALLYIKGWGTKQNLDQSKIYADKSCNFGIAEGCAWVGVYYYAKGNNIQAKIYYDKACNLGQKDVCNIIP